MAHESENQNHFVKVFIGVLIALTVFSVFCAVLARSLDPGNTPDDKILRAALLERIKPVASVNTSEADIQTAAVATAAPAELTAEEMVATGCAACHQAGVAGAPKIDDDAEWAKRREAGLEALVASVINGKGGMPPRAGTQYTDEQLTLAVQQLAGFEVAESAAAPEASETETAAAETAAPAATVAAVAGSISDKAKQTADSVCTACHLAGVAGAPKLGDKEAWAARAEKGLDGMVQVVVAGQGGMPPRGGSDLTEAEIAEAIEYLMSK